MFLSVFLPLALVIIMFSLGLGLTLDDFARVARRPKAFAIGAVSQLVLIPAVAFVITLVFALPPELALGVMILSFCPGGATSNLLTRFAGGDLALSISLTGVISLVSVITLPLLVSFVSGYFLGADAPLVDVTPLGLALFALMAVPVAIGLALRHYAGGFARAIDAHVRRIANILFVAVIVGALAVNWAPFVENLFVLGPALIVLNVVLLFAGLGLARTFGLDLRQAKAVAIETGIQNAALGINVGVLIAGQPGELPSFSVPPGVYGITMYFVSAPIVLWLARRT